MRDLYDRDMLDLFGYDGPYTFNPDMVIKNMQTAMNDWYNSLSHRDKFMFLHDGSDYDTVIPHILNHKDVVELIEWAKTKPRKVIDGLNNYPDFIKMVKEKVDDIDALEDSAVAVLLVEAVIDGVFSAVLDGIQYKYRESFWEDEELISSIEIIGDDEDTVLATVETSPASLLMTEGDDPPRVETEPTELHID